MTHGSVAKKVREDKEKHPERYCSVAGCLWKTAKFEHGSTPGVASVYAHGANPCHKHPQHAIQVDDICDSDKRGNL